jgi:DNA (cytosine-5)-methyltransferase 1
MGYHRAGFDLIVGVDNRNQPRYPFYFIQGDVFDVLAKMGLNSFGSFGAQDSEGRTWSLSDFDLIHASPPCQFVTKAGQQWRNAGREYPDLLAPTRVSLKSVERPYVIENVPGAPLENPIMLNGAFCGLRVKRDRFFECSFPIDQPLLLMDDSSAKMGRPWDARKGQLFYPVGHFSGVAAARVAMGIPWMTQAELSQAIPPAYTEYIGTQFLATHAPAHRVFRAQG